MEASHRDKKGVWTVAVMWPAAATMRFIAATTVGWVVSASAGEVGSYGASRAGKSRGGCGGIDGVVGTLGDGGGEA